MKPLIRKEMKRLGVDHEHLLLKEQTINPQIQMWWTQRMSILMAWASNPKAILAYVNESSHPDLNLGEHVQRAALKINPEMKELL